MGLLTVPIKAAKVTVGAALLGGDAALSATRTVSGAVADAVGAPLPAASALVSDVAGVVVEAFAGPPMRRNSTCGDDRWIEVRGLDGPDADRIARAVLGAVEETPGVVSAVINPALARVIVNVDSGGPTALDLVDLVATAEASVIGSRAEGQTPGVPPSSLPGDDAVLIARLVGLSTAAAGLVASAGVKVFGVGGINRALTAPVALASYTPAIRHRVEDRLGRDAGELVFVLLSSVTHALGASPGGMVVDTTIRAMLAAEAANSRRAWQRHEQTLSRQAFKTGGIATARAPRPHYVDQTGIGATYADRAMLASLGAAAVVGVTTRDLDQAGAAALATVPKASRSMRESFACALTRGLAGKHDSLVLRPVAVRLLSTVDTVLIDPRALYSDELTVTRVEGVTPKDRDRAWEAARAALAAGLLTPGWHELTDIPETDGVEGTALISPLRDPYASALVTEARRVGVRVISLDDDGLRSLGQGFDDLKPFVGSIDDSMKQALDDLNEAGASVAVVTTDIETSTLPGAVVIGVWHEDSAPPWGADILVPDLAATWRLLHALPAARKAVQKGIELSASGSVLGALMLIPGVVGNGPGTSVDLAALAALWSGYRLGAAVFDDPLPHPEPGYDWFALPGDEVRHLLPRPEITQLVTTDEESSPIPVPLRPLAAVAGGAWHTVSELVGAIKEDLDDPITPILMTGAAATALLGSPLDAVLVGGVLLLNTAIGAEQTVHAERVLNDMLVGQEPLARRIVGPAPGGTVDEVSAGALRPGDLIRVSSGEVVPADARILSAESVEVDESALTGESLPVPKSTAATPGAPMAERSGVLYSGTTMIAGSAVAVVTSVGAGTQMNRASAMTARKARKVGLQAQLSDITRQALPWTIAGGGAVGILSLLRGTPLKEAVSGGVAVGVAAVPEGLPLVATLAQLAASRQLTSADVLVRNPRAVEAFARLDVVCFDKTGTLSENRLAVTTVRPVGATSESAVLGAAVHTVTPAKGKHFDHATDAAVSAAAAEIGVVPGGTAAHLPFQSDRPYAAGIIGNTLSVKGAPEAIFAGLAYGTDDMRAALDEMTAQGLRVLAVAERTLTTAQIAAAAADQDILADLCTAELTPLGLIGIADTLRPAARPLIEELRRRDIGIRLITGDHPVTARVIAADLGLAVGDDEVMTGSEWEILTTEGRSAAVKRCQVFARMAPEHKVQVVQALEEADLVSAMVGDGANDAAAIRAATVGVGLVASGSDPARTAADVLLLDGQIGALIKAIDEGHQLWRRVQASVSMLVGHSLGEVAFGLISSVVNGQPALSARQILLVNLLTDAFPGAALAVSQQVGDGSADFDEKTLWRGIYAHAASTTVGSTLAWSLASSGSTASPQRAATVGLLGLVGTQIAQIVSESHGKLVVMTSVGTFAMMAGVISTPGLSQLFGCTPVGPVGWGQAALGVAAAMAVGRATPEALEEIGEWLRTHVEKNTDPGDTESAVQAANGLSEILRRFLVDDQDTGTDEQRVDTADRRREQTSAGVDQRVGSHRASDLSHVGQPNRTDVDKSPTEKENPVLSSARGFVESHRDLSQLVAEADKISIQLPGIGRVGVPGPDKLAFYGALGLLAALGVIEWPVAVAVGLGHAVSTNRLENRVEHAEAEVEELAEDLAEVEEIADEMAEQLAIAPASVRRVAATKAPVKKASARKAPAKKAPAKKAAATKAPAKKSVATAD